MRQPSATLYHVNSGSSEHFHPSVDSKNELPISAKAKLKVWERKSDNTHPHMPQIRLLCIQGVRVLYLVPSLGYCISRNINELFSIATLISFITFVHIHGTLLPCLHNSNMSNSLACRAVT